MSARRVALLLVLGACVAPPLARAQAHAHAEDHAHADDHAHAEDHAHAGVTQRTPARRGTSTPVQHADTDHDAVDHRGTAHGGQDHGETDHGDMDHGQVDHGTMDHGDMDHGQMDHGTMDHGQMDHGGTAMPPGRHAPRTPVPVPTDADRAAAFPDLANHATHDRRIVSLVQFNRFEATDGDHGSGFAWEGNAWVGTDWHKLWLRSDGERAGGETEAASLEVLYGRPVARWWDAVVGLRHDFKPGSSRTWAAIGVMGVAPQKFEVEATAYLGESGDLAAGVEAEYELLLTNRLALQPLLEATLYSDADPLRGLGSGLATAELGLRLRYEFSRRFAPYVGVVRERAFGETADLRRAAGEAADDSLLVAGLRFWF